MRTAEAAFVVLIPGFFFYQTALGLGLIPPFLGGYFSSVGAMTLPFLVFAYLRKILQDPGFLTWMDRLFFLFLLYFLFVVALHASQGADRVIVTTHIAAILHFIVVYIIFRISEFDSRGIKYLLMACLAGMSLLIFSYSVDGIFYLRVHGDAVNKEAVSTYQSFALVYLLTFSAVVPFVRRSWLRLLLYGMGVQALFLNGARSEFLGLILAIAMLEFIYSTGSLSRSLFFLGASCAVFLSAPAAGGLAALLPNNRVFGLLSFESSTSWQGRVIVSEAAKRTIAAHPILGSYASYPPGEYAHNFLSAWVDLGLFGFVYLGLLVTVPLLVLSFEFASPSRRKLAGNFALAFILGVVTVMLLLTAKTFTYMVIGAGAGAYASYRHRRLALETAAAA